jgi:orotidine-5'-phosphate decarboxylase
MNVNIKDPKVVIALDYADAKSALALVNQLDPSQCKLKVGKELFTSAGPQLVEQLVAKDFKVFLDLKFHDIPNTVAKACEAASNLGVWMLNVHASGGSAMMQSALEGVDKSTHNPYLIAVTVLTSMNQANLDELGVQNNIEDQVVKLASLSEKSGLHGVVCSAMEAERLRTVVNPNFLLVTPGIRPANASADDQTRIMTPSKALSMGASYLVVGRPITQAQSPIEALQAINQSIN